MQTLLVKGASAVSGWLIGVGLAVIGYVANVEQTVNTIMGMRVLMMIIPAVLAGVSFIVYKKYFLLNGSFHDNMLKALNNRKALDAKEAKEVTA